MNISTFIVLLIVILIVVVAIIKIRKKGGCAGCSHSKDGGCSSSCHSSGHIESATHNCCSGDHGKEIDLNNRDKK